MSRNRQVGQCISHQHRPLISVIMPVYNGIKTVNRAIESVVRQTFDDWELVIVDDCSTDRSWQELQHWSKEDDRIQVYRSAKNSGASAARNYGLRHVRGKVVCYLDCDDEYYPDYLQKIAVLKDRGDVLVSQFEIVRHGGTQPGAIELRDPASWQRELFERNKLATLSVAHHSGLISKIGGFNELLWNSEDRDVWRRLARAGAKFLYLEFKSGCYHFRTGGQTRRPNVTEVQRNQIEENWRAGRPIYIDDRQKIPNTKIEKVALVSAHVLVGTSDQSAEAAARALQILDLAGFDCRIFCASHLGSAGELCYEEILAQRQIPYEGYQAQIGGHEGRLIFARQGNVPATIFRTQSTGGRWINEEEAVIFLTAYDLFLKKNRPDAVITHRRDPLCGGIVELAKRYDIPVVYWLSAPDHMDLRLFRDIDYAVVPSEQLRDWYYDRIGLMCHLLPPVDERNPDRVAPAYREFFENVFPQPFPPILPKPEHLAQR